jgi:GalNAc-alpha-(1->4)-GalNAc-alpha-(1->3)-diNAcBac-PP-undecaprenol alpha-1,4-N-acetyl-D-galactosaminyltransferase
MSKQKKIFIVNNGIDFGGIQLASTNFANYCAFKGYSVILMTMFKNEHSINLNPSITFYEPEFLRSEFGKFSYSIKLGKLIRKKIIIEKPDVIITHGEWESGFITMLTTGLKIPVYIQNHMNPNLEFRALHEYFNKVFYPRAKGVIALTEYAADVIKKRYRPKSIIALPNPVRKIKRIDVSPEKRIVTIGRLSKEKGHKYLIEAISKMNLDGWVLDIIGDGPERKSLEELVEKNSLVDKVFFHGMQKDISLYLSRSKIFVLPSLSEAFPLALIEAMSLGLACISTDCLAGNSVIIENEVNGLVVKPADSNQLMNSMNLLINNESLCQRLSIKALEIGDTLSEDKIYKKYLEFIIP